MTPRTYHHTAGPLFIAVCPLLPVHNHHEISVESPGGKQSVNMSQIFAIFSAVLLMLVAEGTLSTWETIRIPLQKPANQRTQF